MTPPPGNILTPPPNNNDLLSSVLNNDFGFGSNTTNLEYGMISSMIPSNMIDYNSSNRQSMQQQQQQEYSNWLPQPRPQQQPQQQNQPRMMDSNTMILNNTSGSGNTSPSLSSSTTTVTTPAIASTAAVTTPIKVMKRRKGVGTTPEDVYTRVQRPYNYAESYHYLIQYVKQRMGRDELNRISRALVLFRPSYMSLVAALTEEDLIYMEKCVQRTLLEFEKLITFSGTPTVVWRRTGEIILVGKEFSLLTLWNKETLLGKKTYIYEVK